MTQNRNEPVTLTKAEIKFLEALIELEQEERDGTAETVTIFDSPDGVAIWAKVGKWAWKNKWKLVTATEAVIDAVGGVLTSADGAEGDVSPEMRAILSSTSESTLDDLIAAREQIYRAIESQGDTPSER